MDAVIASVVIFIPKSGKEFMTGQFTTAFDILKDIKSIAVIIFFA